MAELDKETLARLVLTDATEGPKDVKKVEDIEYKKEGGDDGGKR